MIMDLFEKSLKKIFKIYLNWFWEPCIYPVKESHPNCVEYSWFLKYGLFSYSTIFIWNYFYFFRVLVDFLNPVNIDH